MDIKDKRKVASKMLEDLGEQHTNGGFNEYSHFCEDVVSDIIPKLNNSQLEWLLKKIEETSYPKINRDDY